MREIVLISGRICTGKSGLARCLRDEFNYHIIQTSALLVKEAKKRGKPTTRKSLQALGNKLDRETSNKWVLSQVKKALKNLPIEQAVAVDNIRNSAQLEHFRSEHDLKISHAHLYAPISDLEARFTKKIKKKHPPERISFSDADPLKDDKDLNLLARDADVRVNTARTDTRDTLVRVAARLGLYASPDVRCVDVVVGGQYGSEGKGHIAAYLAREYDVLVRVGGPNAGHTVSSASGVYTYHQLPSGARDTAAILLLGPGMTLNVELLLDEIRDCGITPDRLFIDPQATIIEDEDREKEKNIVATIGSTGSGSGAAAARRITERHGKIRLAKDIPELEPYVGKSHPYRGSTRKQLERAYQRAAPILLEGTQGSGLSVFHGPYPHVTSRDTNVAGCLAEAGISPGRVRRIIMVVRPTPIRVGDPDGLDGHTSGPLKHAVTFRRVAEAAGLDPREVEAHEKTSTTRRDRRVGWFEWEQFRDACAINAPTDIVLTFADYIRAKNQGARRFEQLTEDTIKFIEELERVAHAPVSLINTRFPRTEEEKIDLRTVIDRRDWGSRRK